MKQDLLMDFLQTSEMLKTGKKHHHRKCKQEKTECSDSDKHGRKRPKKMSFTTRTTLLLLLKHESLNQRNIAKTLNVSAQAVSEIIKKLLEQELINKESGELNNENIITLTEDGKSVAEKIDSKMNTLSENIFNNFTEDEIETLKNLLSKMKSNKENICDMEMGDV